MKNAGAKGNAFNGLLAFPSTKSLLATALQDKFDRAYRDLTPEEKARYRDLLEIGKYSSTLDENVNKSYANQEIQLKDFNDRLSAGYNQLKAYLYLQDRCDSRHTRDPRELERQKRCEEFTLMKMK